MLNLLHSKTNQSVNSWISNAVFFYAAASAVVSAPLAVLSKMSPGWFGNLNWAQAILFGLFDAVGLTLAGTAVFAIGAWAYRKIRPLAPAVASPRVDGAPSSQMSDDEALKEVVYGLTERVTGLIKDVESLDRRVMGEVAVLTPALERVRVDGAIATSDIQKLTSVQQHDYKRVSASLNAIWIRERLSELAVSIELDAKDLSTALLAGESYDISRWNSWESVHGHWQRCIEEWVESGRWFAPRVKDRVLTVDDKHYRLKWNIREDQFSDSLPSGRSEAVRQFKKFQIIQTQWEAVRKDVEYGLVMVAFMGLSEEEARQERQA
ncbi:MAG: hypothetical protein V4475_21875 [Pseudomonadota bacterium]